MASDPGGRTPSSSDNANSYAGTDKCHPDLTNRILLGEARLEDELHPDWAYFVTTDFATEHKIPTAERLCRQQDGQCRVTLANFEPLLRDALAFLGIGEAAEVIAAA